MPAEPESVAPPRLNSFHELMQRRIRRILLVSSLYDSFIMSEEGHLHETLLGHFIDMNLSQIPDLVQVSSAGEAVELVARDDDFDLVVASVQAGDENAAGLCARLRAAGHEVPVIGLAYGSHDLQEFLAANDCSALERVYLWQGDVRIFMAMVKALEDRLNAPNDTGVQGVPAILVVEDNVRFYSSFLPTIYTEVLRHTRHLLSEGLNPSQRMMRMRARPKVLMCETYEEAWEQFELYQPQILGLISDVEFPRGGQLDERAGIELCTRALEVRPGIRIVLQSSRPENERLARELGASFLQKGSPVLLNRLRTILVERFGFGDFVFRRPSGQEIDRASDLKSLAEKLRTAPSESVAYHAERNHFSNWLKARTEFDLADRLRPLSLEDFAGIDEMRQRAAEVIEEFLLDRHRTVITDFDRTRFEPSVSIARVGGGSLGGKARGVAFANRILRSAGLDRRFTEVDIHVPPSVVLATDVFDEFMEFEGLRDFAIGEHPDKAVIQQFLEAPFPRRAISDMQAFLQRVKYPLAVRSSSLLEDSLSQPFAGVYRTFMLANNRLELEVRWMQLANAIKQVYASAFLEQAKAYLELTSFRLEEEKMAVMIQELVGNQHEDRFYPDFAGVARSYDYYPEPGHAPEDGVVAVALGLGQTVVGGSPCLRFCPRYPRQVMGFSSVKDALENSQREFAALDLGRHTRSTGLAEIRRHGLEVAESDGTLGWLGSTWMPEDNRVVDGISRDGVRLVSFAQVLKHGDYPLADLVAELLERCSQGAGAPVEIEFAGNLPSAARPRAEFAFLQMRPMSMSREREAVSIGEVAEADLVCRSPRVLGNGRIDDLVDLIVVGVEGFERRKSPEVALEVARLDALLRKEGRAYLLVGVGRWGSSDPHLGIPVGWNQISGARVIVEAGFEDFRVAPSQGTHFFQNLTSGNVGYFTVNPDLGEGVLDWSWLANHEALRERGHVRHLRLDAPVVVKMSGHTGEGVILKPGRG